MKYVIKYTGGSTPTVDPKLIRTDADIKTAVDEWTNNSELAKETYGHISDWNTRQVTNMEYLFYEKENFNDDISKWDVSNVTSMEEMFTGAKLFNKPLNSWDVSSVTNMSGMFARTESFNMPLDSWNVSNVKYMGGWTLDSGMFESSVFDQPINTKIATRDGTTFYKAWDVLSVIDMGNMFCGAKFNKPLDKWNVSSVTNMRYMFTCCIRYNQ